MDNLHDNSDIVNSIKTICYLNLSKMPAGKQTNANDLWEKYAHWKDIVFLQLQEYAPKIVVCAGTIDYISDDITNLENVCSIPTGEQGVYLDIYKDRERYYIKAYHPNQRTITAGAYVNSLIEALKMLSANDNKIEVKE